MADTDVAAPGRLERVFAAEPASVGMIRREVAAFARLHGAGDSLTGDITLAVSEAATNAVVHAFAGRQPGRLRIIAEPGSGSFHVAVVDDGRGMKPRGDSPGLGLGLPTIAQLTASFDVRDGAGGQGTEVHLVFEAPEMRPAAAPEGTDAWRLELLAEVTRLTGTGWPGEGVERLVDLVVPAVADACTLDLVEPQGTRRVAARVHAAMDLSDWLAARSPAGDALRSALPALRAGDVHVTVLDDDVRRALARDADDIAQIDATELAWWVSIPLFDHGVLMGSLGLGLRSTRQPPEPQQAFFAALGERAARGLGGAHLVAELRRTRRRLERILSVLSEAITVQDAGGRVVYANEAAAELLGAGSVDEVLAARPGELAARFDITLEDGTRVRVEDLPGQQVLRGRTAVPLLTRSVERASGRERWLLTKATRLDDGEPFAVNIIDDITDAKNAELRRRVLAQVGELGASALAAEDRLARVAELAVPAAADWCAIDAGGRRVAEAGHVGESRSELAVPLQRGHEMLGTLHLATVAGGRELGAEQRAFAEDLASRAAQIAG